MTEKKIKKTSGKKILSLKNTRKKTALVKGKKKISRRTSSSLLPAAKANAATPAPMAVFGMFIRPDNLISELGIREGMRVADLGAGTGYFAFPIARKIGDGGVLFAVDVALKKLEAIESQAKILGISNIITLRGNLEERRGSGIPEEEADWAVLVNVLFQNKNKKPIVWEVFRVLKKGGKALVLEWNEKKSPIGPSPERRISRQETEKMFEEAGLSLKKEINAGDFHYGLIFVKQ